MKHFLASLGVVFGKELTDGLRDRRSILSAVVPLAILPLMILFSFYALSEEIDRARSITVPVIGAEHAQTLVDWLDQQTGVEIELGISEPRALVRSGERDFVLVVPEEFGTRFEGARTAELEIVVDSSDRGADRAADRLRSLLRSYGAQVSTQRLIARGISPEVIAPVRIETIDMATRQERLAMVFAFIPMFLVMTAFLGGLQIAIDSTAGERERLSLEPLLLNPVPHLSIVGGKWLASTVFALASLILTAGVLMVVLDYSPMQRLGLNLEMGVPEFISMLGSVLPLALLASALQMGISTLARSYKEAQTYVSFLMFVPLLPMMMSMGSSIEPTLWKLAVPILGQHILVTEVLEGNIPEPLWLALATASTIAGTVLCLVLTAQQFRREKIVFGR